MRGDDRIAVTLRRNDLRLILGATIAEAHMHSSDGRHATAAWAHDVAAKIADAIGDSQAAKMQRDGAAAETTRWQQLHPEQHDPATERQA